MKQTFSLLVILAFFAFMPAQAQQTKRVYLIGNSVTDRLKVEGFKAFALSQNNTHIWGAHFIPGASLAYLWAERNVGKSDAYGSLVNAFENFEWDAVTLQPFDRSMNNDIDDLLNYARLIKDKSPGVQFYVYSRYPRAPSGKTYLTATGEDWKKLWENTYGAGGQSNEHRKYFEELREAFNATDRGGLNKPALLMPLGDILYAFNEKAMKGEVPGHASAWDIYADGIHMNGAGEYLVMATFYTTIYKEDIRGTKVPANYGVIDPSLVEILQQTIYEIVFNHPYSGATLADIVPVTGVALDKTELNMNVFNRLQLKATIEPANASKKGVIWSSSDPGVVMTDQTGKITSLSPGTATITATTLDGSFTDECEITVSGEIKGEKKTGVLAHWDFRGTVSTTANNTPATAILSGIGETNVYIGTGLNARGWGDHFVTGGQTTMDLLSSIGDNEYIGFEVKPEKGKLITIDKIEYTPFNEGGVRQHALCSNINGFVAGKEISTHDIGKTPGYDYFQVLQTIPIANHTNLDEVEFRVYIYGEGNQYQGVGIGGGFSNGLPSGDVGKGFVVTGSVFTPENDAPSAPGEVQAVKVSDTAIGFEWGEATDDYFVKGYNFYLDGEKINDELIEETTFTLENLTSGQLCEIEVEAVDYFGVVSESKASLSIHANRPPIAVITPSATSGKAPLAVTFTSDASTDPDEDEGDYVLGFDWYIDGELLPENGNTLSYTFTKKGDYEVGLIVMDSRGLRGSEMSTTAISVTADKYTVSVTGGTTDPVADDAFAGDEVAIVANTPAQGMAFDKWTSNDVTFADETSTETTFTMPAKAVEVTATYKYIEYTITVENGTADKETAPMGTLVTIETAELDCYENFLNWSSSDVEVDNELSIVTTFTMPAKNVTIEAIFISIIGVAQSDKEGIAIYPNPADEYITITGIANAAYAITNVTGATVQSGVLTNGEPLFVGSLAAGFYLLQIDNTTITFIKK